MASLFANLYYLRKVAQTSSSPCLICYKSVDSVLTTPDHKDFFYVCTKHLQDRHFATAVVTDDAPTAQPEGVIADGVDGAAKAKAGDSQLIGGKSTSKVTADSAKTANKTTETADGKPQKEFKKPGKESDEKNVKSSQEEPPSVSRVYSLHKWVFEDSSMIFQ